MLRLTQAPDIATAMLWSDLLCEAGMPASVQRQHLGAAAGHLPPGECLPEIWLAHAEHADPARALLRDYESLPQRPHQRPPRHPRSGAVSHGPARHLRAGNPIPGSFILSVSML